MVSAGIPDQEIMGIGGFYTRSIFDRYFIIVFYTPSACGGVTAQFPLLGERVRVRGYIRYLPSDTPSACGGVIH